MDERSQAQLLSFLIRQETYLESILASSPSTPTIARGSLASMTYLSQLRGPEEDTVAYILIIAMWAVLVRFLIRRHILPECLLALPLSALRLLYPVMGISNLTFLHRNAISIVLCKG
jgi:hypothetical protein